MPKTHTQCTHITRSRGVYHYRRRLPGQPKGEVTLSLVTRNFREAEHRAALLDRNFTTAWGLALSTDSDGRKLASILRDTLRTSLTRDLERRMNRRSGHPLYAYWLDDDATEAEIAAADLACIRDASLSLQRDLAQNSPDDLREAELDRLMQAHGLPDAMRGLLNIGLQEAGIRAWKVIERRQRGLAPLVFEAGDEADHSPPSPPSPTSETPSQPPVEPEPKPLASEVVVAFMAQRRTIDRATHQVMGQESGTLRRFLEVAGDRPIDRYGRGDITKFLATLRRLPTNYGKSPRDRDRSLEEIIAAADGGKGDRISDKTVKRHLSALSQFLQIAVDAGHITVAARVELVEGHRFREEGRARDQRDEWGTADLVKLFASPVWTGCHAYFRTAAGPAIVRDAKFWLPILALHHGARLEEFADLYRRDVGRDGDIPFLRITETEDRRLKTDNAERVIPLHPELVSLGFLDYVAEMAPDQDDPLFPDLEPQGRDRKRGPRITRWFVEYRRAIGVFREGVGMHAFRHTAITRLRNAITDHQQDRHVDFLMGHARGGGEGRERYDKGPGLKALADTLALLRFPEVDLSHLHVALKDDQRAA